MHEHVSVIIYHYINHIIKFIILLIITSILVVLCTKQRRYKDPTLQSNHAKSVKTQETIEAKSVISKTEKTESKDVITPPPTPGNQQQGQQPQQNQPQQAPVQAQPQQNQQPAPQPTPPQTPPQQQVVAAKPPEKTRLNPFEYIRNKLSKSKEKITSKEKVTPSKEKVQPSKEKIQPSKEKIQPSKEKIQASKEKIQPSKEKMKTKVANRIKSFFRIKGSGSKEKVDPDKALLPPATVSGVNNNSTTTDTTTTRSNESTVAKPGEKQKKKKKKRFIGDNLKTAEENVDGGNGGLEELLNRVIDPSKAVQMGNIDDITMQNREQRIKEIEQMPDDEYCIDTTQRSISLKDNVHVKIAENNCKVYIMNPDAETKSMRDLMFKKRKKSKSRRRSKRSS